MRLFDLTTEDYRVPSLDPKTAQFASEEERGQLAARTIGRKSNAYGRLLANVMVQQGMTVQDVVREHLTAALVQAGYTVEQAPASPDALLVDVEIKRFWTWAQPGAWQGYIHAAIETDLYVSGLTSPASIRVHVKEKCNVFTENAWTDIVSNALASYRSDVKEQAGSILRRYNVVGIEPRFW